jgi:predicted phage-related endonuclease
MLKASRRLLDKMKGANIMSSAELATTARVYREIQAEIKTLEEQADALKQQLIKEMDARNVEKLEAGEFTIRWSLCESSRLDSTKLKAAHSDLYSQCCKKTVSTRFQVA